MDRLLALVLLTLVSGACAAKSGGVRPEDLAGPAPVQAWAAYPEEPIPGSRTPAGYDAPDPDEPYVSEMAAREWMTARYYQEQAYRRAAAAHDILYGMTREEVQRAWGEPNDVEVAGQARLGNERWIYDIGSPGSLSGSTRVIFFEAGRVAGWETH